MKFSDKQILTLGDDLKRAGYDYQARLDILRAVNSHEELLRAVQFARNVIDGACGQLSSDEAKRIYNMAVKAIAKAEGE